MKTGDADEQIDLDVDRVLRELTRAMPPERMEQRVLAAIEQRPAIGHRRDIEQRPAMQPQRALPAGQSLLWPFGWLGHPGAVWRIAAAVMAMAAAALVTVKVHERTPSYAHIGAHTPAQHRQPLIAQTSGRPRAHRVPLAAAKHATAEPPMRARVSETPLDPAVCHCDPVAMAEAAAPSHPAPPIPLTSEEKRIVRLLRDGQYQQLANLDLSKFERELAQSRAEFDAYFPTPPPVSATTEEGMTKP